MSDWQEFLWLWLVGVFVVSAVMHYEKYYQRELYPGVWAFGAGILYGIIDHCVTAYYAIP